MIIYSFLVYILEYQRQLNAVYHEMRLFQDDQVTMVDDLESDTANFIVTFVALMDRAKHESKKISDLGLEPILLKYAERGEITAIFLLEYQEDGKMICSKSTLPLYKNVDFAPYFPKGIFDREREQIFLSKDPVFGSALFIAYRIPDDLDDKKAMMVICYSLENLTDWLNEKRTILEMNISITNADLEVLSSTDPILVRHRFQKQAKGGTKGPLTLTPTSTYKDAYRFSLLGETRFCVISKLPHTDAYLLTSVPSKVLLSKMLDQIYHLGILLACVLIIGGIMAMALTKRLGRPLRQLGHVMDIVGEGKLSARYKHDRIGFEINYIGDRFNEMVVSLTEYLEEVKRERASKEAYAKELQIGHEIQKSILPHEEAEFPGLEIVVYFKAAKEVAGDFFDWLIKESELLVTIADGVGKGISGALYAFDLRSILRSFATTESELKEVVIKTNQLFRYDTKDTGNFVTAFLALYDGETRTLQYVNCGHNYPILKRATGEIIHLETKGIAFGVDEITEVDVKTIDLSPGDLIIMYTDGITDAQNRAQELYTEKRLHDLLVATSEQLPDPLIKEIIAGIEAFMGGADQYDDMTLIIMKVK